MWHNICDNNDILNFMNQVCYFHDSCIKEIKYLSGAYVNDNLSMHPINDRRILKVVMQRQFEDFSMIEMEFEGLKYLKLFPIDDEHTCEILDSNMFFKNECIYWCDCSDLAEADLDSYIGTMICALKLRWRSINNCMGKGEFYHPIV